MIKFTHCFTNNLYSKIGVILSCTALGIALLNCQKKDDSQKVVYDNWKCYVFNDSFRIKIPDYFFLNSKFGDNKLINEDNENNTYYYQIKDYVAFTNDTIDATILFYWSEVTNNQTHHNQRLSCLFDLKRIFDKRIEEYNEVGDLVNFINYQYVTINNNQSFHVAYDKNTELATEQTTNIYQLWNYDEQVMINIDYYGNSHKAIIDDCNSIINTFEWENPK